MEGQTVISRIHSYEGRKSETLLGPRMGNDSQSWNSPHYEPSVKYSWKPTAFIVAMGLCTTKNISWLSKSYIPFKE